MASTSVVRIGPIQDNVSAKVLQTAIVSFLNRDSNKDGTVLVSKGDAATAPASFTDATITISNKYFDAKVLFHGLDEDVDDSLRTESTEDGIILCFPSLESNPDMQNVGGSVTFDSLDSVHRAAEESDRCGDVLRLCVGVAFDDLSPSEIRGKDHEEEYSHRIMWCLDHGYEYVEANLSQKGQSQGHSERDKDGFARIIEAVRGTVWTSAVMRRSRQSTGQSSAAKLDGGSDATERENGKLADRTAKKPSSKSSASASSGSDPFGEIKQNDDVDVENDEENEEADKLFDQMDRLLKEASEIRQASKAGSLSDDERRERAGDAALSLMTLMNQLGMEEGGDEDSDNDNSLEDGS